MEKRFEKRKVAVVLSMAVVLSLISTGVTSAAIPVVSDVIKNPAEVPPPISRDDPSTVTVNLVAKEVIAELVPANPATLAPPKQFLFWTYNGTVPGPMVRVMEGDTVVVNLANDPNNKHTHNIDFHAVMGPGGGAAVTNVAPGETKTLTFKAMRAGAYIYHCAAEGKPWEHVSHGQYGLIMVEPKGGLPAVDKEFYVGQGEWYLKPDQESGGYYDLDTSKAAAEHPDFFTLNGNTKALPKGNTKMVVNQGDKVRLFFGTGGPNVGSNFHIIGQVFDKVYTGHPKDFTRNEETVYIAPGDGAVFEFDTLVPGDYNMVDHALWRASKGAIGFLHVNPLGLWPFELYLPKLDIPVIT